MRLLSLTLGLAVAIVIGCTAPPDLADPERAAGSPAAAADALERQTGTERPGAGAHGRRPNVILFLVDDLGWHDVGFMGNTFVETPRADALAREGLVFRTAYANAPNCTPSRASLLAGAWPPRTGVYTVRSSSRGDERLRRLIPVPNREGLAPDRPTLPGVLRAAGWRTAAIGKWHLDSDPAAAGFDLAVGGDDHGAAREGHFAPFGIEGFEDGPVGTPLVERLTDEALAFIDRTEAAGGRDSRAPFFLYLSHYSVHTPIQAPAELKRKYELKRATLGDDSVAKPGYAGMIEALDRSLGRLLDELEARDLTRDTIFVFASDNGGSAGLADLAPLSGGKGSLLEGGLRVPLAVRWPSAIEAGRSSAAPVILSDLAATLLDACGVAPPSPDAFDGESWWPLLAHDAAPAERALFWHFPVYLKPGRGATGFRATPGGAIRRGDLKLIEDFELGTAELYDLAQDPGERVDTSAARPADVARLRAELAAWRERTGAVVPTELNPEFDAEHAANVAPERAEPADSDER